MTLKSFLDVARLTRLPFLNPFQSCLKDGLISEDHYSMDTVSKEKRSEMMSHVKGRDSKMEVSFRKELWKHGFRYRKNSTKYFGTPDIVLPKYKTTIFLDSCFWHGCKEHCRLPTTRAKFWKEKIERNKERDREVNKHYKRIGWRVIRLWEHDLKRKDFKFDFQMIKLG